MYHLQKRFQRTVVHLHWLHFEYTFHFEGDTHENIHQKGTRYARFFFPPVHPYYRSQQKMCIHLSGCCVSLSCPWSPPGKAAPYPSACKTMLTAIKGRMIRMNHGNTLTSRTVAGGEASSSLNSIFVTSRDLNIHWNETKNVFCYAGKAIHFGFGNFTFALLCFSCYSFLRCHLLSAQRGSTLKRGWQASRWWKTLAGCQPYQGGEIFAQWKQLCVFRAHSRVLPSGVVALVFFVVLFLFPEKIDTGVNRANEGSSRFFAPTLPRSRTAELRLTHFSIFE